MSQYNIAKLIPLAFGVIVGIVFSVILIVLCNRNKKVMTEYDERQKLARGKAFMFGFYTMVISAGILALLDMVDIDLCMTASCRLFTVIFLGMVVDGCYCIAEDAYWGLNNNKKAYTAVFAFLGLLNLFVAYMNYLNGNLIRNGELRAGFMNVLCAALFVVFAIATAIKTMVDKGDD